MITLPEDKILHPVCVPHNFFIYGATMSGKSFLASHFSHPLVLNTDGNSEQGIAPSIQIRNKRDANGNLTCSAIKMLDEIIIQLQQPQCKFRTVIIDVIDDICVMMEQAICLAHHVQALADIPYGKGYAMFNTVLQTFVTDLKALPQDIIYISRELDVTDEHTGRTDYVPSLKTKYYNIVNGNCDLVIRTQKIGNNYYRQVTDRRANYKASDIKDERVRAILEKCQGCFTTK